MPTIKSTRLPKTQEVDFAVVKKLHGDPFPGQRSHRLHLGEAKYLHTLGELHGDQLIFHAVRYRHQKTHRWLTQLIDGYTRVEAVLAAVKACETLSPGASYARAVVLSGRG